MFSLRASVMVIAEAPMSHCPAAKTVPDCRASKPTFSTRSSRSSSSAIAWRRSMSKPLYPLGACASSTSKGG